MATANSPTTISNHYSPEMIFAQNFQNNSLNSQISASGLPSNQGKFGGIGGNMDTDSGLPLSQEGINLNIGSIDSIASYGSAFDQNPFELLFDGSLSPFGLTKSECFSIKSLGILTALNNLTLAKQFNAGLTGKTSVTSKGAENPGA